MFVIQGRGRGLAVPAEEGRVKCTARQCLGHNVGRPTLTPPGASNSLTEGRPDGSGGWPLSHLSSPCRYPKTSRLLEAKVTGWTLVPIQSTSVCLMLINAVCLFVYLFTFLIYSTFTKYRFGVRSPAPPHPLAHEIPATGIVRVRERGRYEAVHCESAHG